MADKQVQNATYNFFTYVLEGDKKMYQLSKRLNIKNVVSKKNNKHSIYKINRLVGADFDCESAALVKYTLD
jgi:hypothetical protein